MNGFLLAYSNVIALVFINGILGLAVYLMLSVNRFSLGSGGFMGVGAYISALVSLQSGAPFWVSVIAGVLVAAVVAVLLGAVVLHLEGDYFALGTLAFTEIVHVAAFNWDSVTGGALGLDGIPIDTTLPVLAATVLLIVAVIGWLVKGAAGRLMSATGQDDMPAQSLGINVTAVRLATFVASGALCGLAGALVAHLNGFIGPDDFSMVRSLDSVSYAVLGGMGHVLGPVAGALIFTVLPELLRFSAQSREIVISLMLLAVVLFLPRGALSFLSSSPATSSKTMAGATGTTRSARHAWLKQRFRAWPWRREQKIQDSGSAPQ